MTGEKGLVAEGSATGFIPPIAFRHFTNHQSPFPSSPSHPHNLVSAIYINDLPSNSGRPVARQEDTRRTQLCGITTASKRSMLLVMLHHCGKSSDPSGRHSLNWSGTDTINSDLFCSDIEC